MATILKTYYSIDNIFNLTSLESLYTDKNIRNDNNNTNVNFAITESDKPLFKKYCKNVSVEIFKRLSFLSKELDTIEEEDDLDVDYKGFEFGVNDEKLGDNLIIFRFVKPEDWYSDMLNALEDKIEECLVNGVLGKWYYKVGLNEAGKTHNNYFEKLLKEARSILLYRRKPPKKKYNFL